MFGPRHGHRLAIILRELRRFSSGARARESVILGLSHRARLRHALALADEQAPSAANRAERRSAARRGAGGTDAPARWPDARYLLDRPALLVHPLRPGPVACSA